MIFFAFHSFLSCACLVDENLRDFAVETSKSLRVLLDADQVSTAESYPKGVCRKEWDICAACIMSSFF